ncbi:MAG: hypothetical protein K2M31_03155 [Muribaculaceae bacterium]|nr:hypothetical protein [Muribaculaceae bacterium]
MRFLLISILTLCGLVSSTASAAYTQANFAKSSRLATGKWVKIAIDKTGVYEISYEALRNMGFPNPEKVGIYGRGNRQFSLNFQSATQVPQYFDDVQPVPIVRGIEKIYFYGQGPEELKYQVNSAAYTGKAALMRLSNNIYSAEGYYFLSDSEEPAVMSLSKPKDMHKYPFQNDGVGYVYHEKDLYHNTHKTGQLFYGEKMTPENPRLRFDVHLPDAIPETVAAVECVAYSSKFKDASGKAIPVTMKYGIEENGVEIPTKDGAAASSDFTAQAPSVSPILIPGDRFTFYLECDFTASDGWDMDTSNLDYWIICYNRNIPTLVASDGTRLAAEKIALPGIGRPNSGNVRIPNGINRIVIDVTDPFNPFEYELYPDGADGIALVKNTNYTPELMIIDPSMPQMQVKNITTDFTEIKNQNIHKQAVDGADLVIICIPQLKESAERLADIHRTKLNQRVIVATTDECYNEFSAGIPDPMAYRGLVKMAYMSDYGCRNLLLMGPLYADFRGIEADKNPKEGIIAFQSTTTSTERGGFNCNDFYGLMIDFMGYTPLENQKIPVGVAILPVRYPAEADNYINKVEAYVDRDDHAYYLNHFLSVGGVGDADLHTSQVPEVDRFITGLGKRTVINTQLGIDAYGYEAAHDKFFRMLDEGVNIVTYYGHGGPVRLNHKGNFFNAPDVLKFRNPITPIWGFAGCELSEPDRGIRGMGESMVTSTPYGMIGTILATRETWSSMNLDFFKKFTANFLRDGGLVTSKPYAEAMTIGQIFARTKTHSTYANEMAYQLICDPAVIIPTVNRYITVDQSEEELKAIGGEWMEVSGFVESLDNPSNVDAGFNGEVVLRLMEPLKEIPCQHLVLKAQKETCPADSVKINLTYADIQSAMAVAKVKNGRFSARIMVPENISQFDGKFGRLHLCAYDPATRLGAAALTYPTYMVAEEGSTTTLSADTQAPVVERLEYLLDSNTLDIRVSDNLALAYDADPLRAPFRLIIDGKEYRMGASIKPRLDPEAMAYEKSITLHDLQEGTHTARIQVRDAAGNETVSEIVFDYLPSMARYAIALEQTAVDGEARFFTLNETPASADLVILSPEGMVVRRDRMTDGRYDWDACDNDGNKVAPGLYKAYLIETGDKQRKGHSAPINVPVI